jgi:hypothetical protein
LTVWDRDPIPRLNSGEHLIVRTPWDYPAKTERFSEWLRALPAARVHNAAEILRWNSEKGYLRDLANDGIPIVPTVWMRAISETDVRSMIASSFPGERKIVKPVFGAGSTDTYRLAPDEFPPPGVFLGRPAMIQPYLEEIETDGERSLVFFDGKFSHGVRKRPRAGDFRVQESYGGVFSALDPTAGELAFGNRVIAAVRARFPEGPPPLYARVDYVEVAGRPQLMEGELLEPDLYFHHAPGAAERFTDLLAGLAD